MVWEEPGAAAGNPREHSSPPLLVVTLTDTMKKEPAVKTCQYFSQTEKTKH